VHEPAREVELGGGEHDRVVVGVAEQQVAAGREHARDLGQERVGGGQRLQRVVADRAAEAAVLERQRLVEVGDDRGHGERRVQLRLAPLDPDELEARPEALAQRRQRGALATSEIGHAGQHRLRERGDEPPVALLHCAPSRSSRSARASPR
jgi:hypothetical protein